MTVGVSLTSDTAVQVDGHTLSVRCLVPAGVDEIEVRLESSRLQAMSRITDVSPWTPVESGDGTEPRRPRGNDHREMWFPVVDVALTPRMTAHAEFSHTDGRWWFNGMLERNPRPVTKDVTIPARMLEQWENSLLVESLVSGDPPPKLCRFWLAERHPVVAGQVFVGTFELLTQQWAGELSMHAVDREATRELAREHVVAPGGEVPASDATMGGRPTVTASRQRAQTAISADPGDVLTRSNLVDCVRRAVGFLERSQNRNSVSPTAGQLYLFYDLDAATYRCPHWMWGHAPGVRLLLDAADSPAHTGQLDTQRLRTLAREVAESHLRFRLEDPRSPARGGLINRFIAKIDHASGYECYASPADAGFYAGWALVPVYEDTGDRRFLDAAIGVADLYERLTDEFELVPQDWLPWHEGWASYAIDEVGFGMEGLAELYRVTGDPRYVQIGRRYIEQCLDKLGRDDGLWDRKYDRIAGERSPTGYMTRGMGWAAESLLAAHRLLPDEGHLERAVTMADHLIRHQQPAGCWAFRFTAPVEQVGITAKGTALWSLLFFRLYAATGDSRHLDAARRALAWCVANQYVGPDLQAVGGLVGCSPHSAVGYRAFFRVVCGYGTSFFGLAALAELARLDQIQRGSREPAR